MKKLAGRRCYIGEGPVWNERESKLYFVNPREKEICTADLVTGEVKVRVLKEKASALAFTKSGEMLVSRRDGAYLLKEDDTAVPLYDPDRYNLENCNDAKVGPDGRFYVGTQSRKRLGISEELDGKLYCIDPDGTVTVLLDGMSLSNGFDWSVDEKRFYHTDSDTHTIREYFFDKEKGRIIFTGRWVSVPGVDGLTIGMDDQIYAACWGRGHVAVVDTGSMEVIDTIKVPTPIPASCCFAGEEMELLAVTTCLFDLREEEEPQAGYTYLHPMHVRGRKPYLFADC